jgi:hypothetical protein
VALLELIAKYGKEVPDVDFVLQPGDRAKVLKHTNPQGAKWLALMLSFAIHPDYQEVNTYAYFCFIESMCMCVFALISEQLYSHVEFVCRTK